MLTNIIEKQTEKATEQERKLILSCCQTKPEPQVKSEIAHLLKENLDWDYIFDNCLKHRVVPLLYQNIKQENCNIPLNIVSKFRDFEQKNTFHNIFITSKLAEVIENFQSAKIPVISFKGSTLAVSAYGNLTLRTFGDADILIEPENINPAVDILHKLGYPLPKQITKVLKTPYGKSSIFNESLNHQKSLEIIDDRQLFAIELHWSLFSKSFPINVSFDSLWQNRTQANVLGKNIPQFAAEDLLLYLCIHGSRHYWCRLQWICDVAEFIRANPQLDWNKTQLQANKWGCRKMLYLGLILAHNLLDARLPENVKQKVDKDNTVRSLFKQISNRLFNDRENSEFENHVFLLKCRDRYRDKLQYIASILFVPNQEDWNFINLPKQLHFLYYAIRSYRLLIKSISNSANN